MSQLKLSRPLDNYIDKYNLIVMKNGEGGDSCHKTCFYLIMRYFQGIIHKPYALQVFLQLQCKTDKRKFIRHPDPDKWYSRCNNLSRDQATALIMGLGLYDQKKMLFRFLIDHLLRFGFMTNTRHNWDYDDHWKIPDFCGPEFFGHYIRLFNAWYLYPLLFLGDVENFINTLIKIFIYGKNPENSDDQNHILSLLLSSYRLPTPISWLSKKLYLKLRPWPKRPDNSPYETNSVAQACLRYYHREEVGAPPLDEIALPIVEGL